VDATRANAQAAVPGFWATLQSEWTKQRTVRSTWIVVGMALGLSIGVSALVAVVSGATYDSWGAGAQASFDPLTISMAGMLFRLILLIVLGVTTVTSEYGSGMLRTTLITTPGRLRVFWAKALIVAGLGLATGALTVPGMFFVSQPIFRAYGLPTATFSDGETARLLVVYAFVQAVVYTLIPFTIAWLLRGTTSAIVVSVGLFALPLMLAPMLPAWLQTNVLRYLPDFATDSLAGLIEVEAATYLGTMSALFVVTIWLVGLLALAATALQRRDV
jgi:ABC-2 type transport system permease protein